MIVRYSSGRSSSWKARAGKVFPVPSAGIIMYLCAGKRGRVPALCPKTTNGRTPS